MNTATTPFRPAGRPTLIGSLPLSEHAEALDWILHSTPDIPLWPQLPGNPREGMMVQFLEGIPCVAESKDRVYYTTADPDFETAQLSFYEEYLQVAEDMSGLPDSRFRVSRERAGGLYLFAEEKERLKKAVALKGQITGPFTQLTSVKDEQDRLGYYDPTIRDMLVKGLALKAAWQVRYLQGIQNLPVLLFIDEPALAGLGSSSFISISQDDIAQDLGEVITAVQQAGGLAGTHVCANTDWNLLLNSAVNIISFDAHGFFDRFITCRRQIHAFLARGGIIAWGLVPTSQREQIESETVDSLVALWEDQAGQLAEGGLDLPALLGQTLITPSCGTGSITPELARRVLDLTRDTAAELRRRYTGEA